MSQEPYLDNQQQTNVKYFRAITEILDSEVVKKDIEYIIERMTDFEDRGFTVKIDICYSINTKSSYSLINNKYLTNFGYERAERCRELHYPESYLQRYDFQNIYSFIRRGLLCYRVSLSCDMTQEILNEMCNKVKSRMEVVGNAYTGSTMFSPGVINGIMVQSTVKI